MFYAASLQCAWFLLYVRWFRLVCNLQKQCHVPVYRMVWHSGMSLWRYFSFFLMTCVPSQTTTRLIINSRKANHK